MTTTIACDGPVISTGDMVRQRALFEGVLGLETATEEVLDVARTAALFGVPGRSAWLLGLKTPGTRIGVWLVQFEPVETAEIRPGGVGLQPDALKVVDFFTPDLDRALARLRRFGFDTVGPPALLELPGGETFQEAHVRAPDGVMVAFIHPLRSRIDDYVSITDRLFSEVQSCSGPVEAPGPVAAFYEQGLGLGCGLQYEFESASFGRMVGAGGTTRVVARNFGRIVEDAMLGVIHYGLPPGFAPSLRESCRAPNRGLVAVRLAVSDLDVIVARCQAAGHEIAVPVAELRLAPWGRVRTATIRGPHGVAHLLCEPLDG